jgi:uncharacterized protein YjbJ (UPF0337 family)
VPVATVSIRHFDMVEGIRRTTINCIGSRGTLGRGTGLWKRNHYLEDRMDWNRVEGNWKQVKGKVKEKWGNLTDDDLTAINGKRDQLEGKIQERYGVAKDQVRKDVDTWYNAQGW